VSAILPFVLVFPFCFVRHVKTLGVTSILANAALLLGALGSFAFFDFAAAPTTKLADWSGLGLFLGIITAAYEGIGLVIPVEVTTLHFEGRYSKLLRITLVLVSLLLGGYGLCGYLSFGALTQQVVTENFSGDSVISSLVQVSLLLGVWLTYPLQMFPVTEIVDQYSVFKLFPEQSRFRLRKSGWLFGYARCLACALFLFAVYLWISMYACVCMWDVWFVACGSSLLC
jgi:solute carrier family 36 (proton-coupled amino acid transporter)